VLVVDAEHLLLFEQFPYARRTNIYLVHLKMGDGKFRVKCSKTFSASAVHVIIDENDRSSFAAVTLDQFHVQTGRFYNSSIVSNPETKVLDIE
jgi:hypothetical protein